MYMVRALFYATVVSSYIILLSPCAAAKSRLPNVDSAAQSLSPASRASYGSGVFSDCTDTEFTNAWTSVRRKCMACEQNETSCPAGCCTYALKTERGYPVNQYFTCIADGCKSLVGRCKKGGAIGGCPGLSLIVSLYCALIRRYKC
jgi:hypothetical protein